MRRFDQYVGPLVIFTIGYILCLTTADTLRVGQMHITHNGVPHLWSASGASSPFWIYVAVVGVIGLAFATFGIYSAVSAYRFGDPSPPQSTGSTVFFRFTGLWFLAGLIYVTFTFLRKWV